MNETHRENRALWEAWSDDFQALWRADTDDGELPPIPLVDGVGVTASERATLLDGLQGADAVELGCGGAQHSVAMAWEGAETVTGVDFSIGQLHHAQRLRDEYGVEVQFVAGDVVDLPLADDSFDVAFSSWVLQMVEDLDACFAEVERILRPGGVFLFDVPHPFYELFNRETHELKFSYHPPDRRQFPIEEEYGAEMIVFNRKIAELHNLLVDTGFRVERLCEPGSDDPDDYEEGAMETQPELRARIPRSIHFRAIAD